MLLFGKSKRHAAKDGAKTPEGGAGTGREARRRVREARELMPWDSMLPSGAAMLAGERWSLSLEVADVNYLIATEEHQIEILDKWAKVLNMFDADTDVQITVVNRTVGIDEVARSLRMGRMGDRLDPLRDEFDRTVEATLSRSSSNTVTRKVLTISVRERDPEQAMILLNRLALSVSSQINAIDGCRVERMTRAARLSMVSDLLRPDEPFAFDEETFNRLPGRPSTKDYTTPSAIDVHDPRTLILSNPRGDTWHRTLWIRDYPPEMSDRLIGKLADLRAPITVSIHFTPHARGEGIEAVKRKLVEIDMQIIGERRRNMKQNLPADEIPADLADAKEQASRLRDDLQHSNQHLIDSVVVIGVSAPDEATLEQTVRDVLAVTRQESCVCEPVAYMQLEGLAAELPLGVDPLPMRRTLTTSSAAILIPFTTQEIRQPGGVWFGVNARSGNALAVDRTTLMNQNGFHLGTTGSGKSQFAKLEITQRVLTGRDVVITIDPEHEYTPLVRALGGVEIEIGPESSQRINPMDISYEDDDGGDPIRSKAVRVLDMLGALIGGTDGLAPEAKGLFDRYVLQLYRERRADPGLGQPTLRDLHDLLDRSGAELGERLAAQIEMYTNGSLSGFAERTNVDLSAARFVNFDVSRLDGELRTFGMMVVLDAVWNRVLANRREGIRTWVYADEFHRFFSNRYAAKTFLDMFKRARKYGLALTGITQNIEELLMNDDARLMLSNSEYLVLLNQTASDADSLQNLLHLSDEQRQFFTGVNAGCGLMKAGRAWVPFDSRIPTDGMLYRLFSTRFGEAGSR
ncbi:DUF87 domain-containing protein [Bifidobacterium margollesii]|uniref:DUF87 domain-containing protein n=1 Tax=Bifidobacterium margollesii TaxID=2020964 RepID=A0A2N5J7C7_9BIFI|nr:type IV secretion system protein VirB4 [Bifidobacterium margollesii]PLS30110.1 DUF87 domain-containing protein [Bifidobacterium margollesii]